MEFLKRRLEQLLCNCRDKFRRLNKGGKKVKTYKRMVLVRDNIKSQKRKSLGLLF